MFCTYIYVYIYHKTFVTWASCQILKIAGCACTGNAGNVFPPPRVSDPDMHHGTCVTPRSLTSGFHCRRWLGKRSRHSRRMRNLQFYVSGERPIRCGQLSNPRVFQMENPYKSRRSVCLILFGNLPTIFDVHMFDIDVNMICQGMFQWYHFSSYQYYVGDWTSL